MERSVEGGSGNSREGKGKEWRTGNVESLLCRIVEERYWHLIGYSASYIACSALELRGHLFHLHLTSVSNLHFFM